VRPDTVTTIVWEANIFEEPVKDMMIDVDDAYTAFADTESLTRTMGREEDTKKELGKFKVIFPPAVADSSPPGLVVNENVAEEANFSVERSSEVMLK
jgi:hypothetical protein